MVALGEIQFQQHIAHAPELPAQVADDIPEVIAQERVLFRRSFLRCTDDGLEYKVQQGSSAQVPHRDVVLGGGLHPRDDGPFLLCQDLPE